MVHIWPYEDLEQRADVRARAIADGGWPPDNNELILDARSEIYLAAPFMQSLGDREIGPVYEMRTYTYALGDMPKVLDAWSGAIAERVKLLPLAGCWYSDIGGLNRFVHLWAYKTYDERARIRSEAVATGVWPPASGVAPLRQENKILLPFDFSPMR